MVKVKVLVDNSGMESVPPGAVAIEVSSNTYPEQYKELRKRVGDSVREFVALEWVWPTHYRNGFFASARFRALPCMGEA